MKPAVRPRPVPYCRRPALLAVVCLVLLGIVAVAPVHSVLAASAAVTGPPVKPPALQYEHLRHAIDAAPPDADDDLDALAGFLGGLGSNDRERAYAIYYWLSRHIAYDTKGFFSGDFGSLTPESVLKRREAVCSGYSRLFQALATRVGLESREVSGASKGYGWATNGTLGDHAWNAVRIDGQWQLLDATWGAGHLDGQNRFVRATDEFYFLTPPEQFVHNHLPKDPQWQLLPSPISRDRFLALPDLDPAFFVRGLTLVGNAGAVLQTGSELALELQSSQDVLTSVDLERNGQKLPEQLAFIERDGSRIRIKALLPMPGRYVLRLFAKPADDPGAYPQAARFIIDAGAGAGGKAGFPQQYPSYQEHRVTGLAPMTYRLPAGQPQRFELRIPGAADVALVDSAGQWHHLSAVGDRWQGDVAAPAGPIELMARFDPAGNQYSGLATYQAE
jgi:hypothetical protein